MLVSLARFEGLPLSEADDDMVAGRFEDVDDLIDFDLGRMTVVEVRRDEREFVVCQ